MKKLIAVLGLILAPAVASAITTPVGIEYIRGNFGVTVFQSAIAPLYITSTGTGGFVRADQGMPGSNLFPWFFSSTRSGGFLLSDQGAPGLLPWHVQGTVSIYTSGTQPIFVTTTMTGGFVLADQGVPGSNEFPWFWSGTGTGGFMLADQGTPGPDATPWPFSNTRSGSFILSDQGKPGPNTTPWFFASTGTGGWLGANVLEFAGTAYLDGDTEAPLASFRIDSRSFLYNGASWDRMRGDIANGLDVDVTRMPAIVVSSIGSTVYPSSGALWGVGGDSNGTGWLSLATTTRYFVSGTAATQHSGNVLMTSNPSITPALTTSVSSTEFVVRSQMIGMSSATAVAPIFSRLSTSWGGGRAPTTGLGSMDTESQVMLWVNGTAGSGFRSFAQSGTTFLGSQAGVASHSIPLYSINGVNTYEAASSTAITGSGVTAGTSGNAMLTKAMAGLMADGNGLGKWAHVSSTVSGTSGDNALVVIPADYVMTTGALSTTVSCYAITPVFLKGRSFTVSAQTAGAYGTTLYVDGSNAVAAPADNDPTAWRCLTYPRWVINQPLGGLDGQVDNNVQYISGVRWIRFRLEVAAKSNTTVNIQSVQ